MQRIMYVQSFIDKEHIKLLYVYRGLPPMQMHAKYCRQEQLTPLKKR